VRDILGANPIVDSLGRNAQVSGELGSFPWASECLDGADDDVHAPIYPMNGYSGKPHYPKKRGAPEMPSWHNTMMASAIDLSSDTPFDAQRVKERMREMGVTQVKLAEEMGLPQSAVSNLLNGIRQAKVYEASFIYKRLGIETERAVAFVPVIGISSAGNWREAVLLPKRQMPIAANLAGARAFAVELQGDSMDELIEEGSYVVVDPDQTHLYNDRVYLIENEEHETQVKLYRSNPGRFEPASTNDTHQPVYIGEQQVRVIGRVVWKGQPL
jgi:repressor LexA